ncbi:hypothetical protein [Brevibacterium renqingii]|uniref:hypothetical protein n=1 Tax=Brevibacterium renqingii TaxID=2776916 RepID=UPI001ADFD923|nr:hypothetical protein [Brevibacterium renqingii]
MDTSIIVVIAIVVVFAVAVPAMIRKSATELSRAEIDSVPDNAAVVAAEAQNPGHDHSERTQVFHDKPRKAPSVPTPEHSPAAEAPALRLSAVTPEFAVIDGSADTTSTVAEVEPCSQLDSMPVAVGETHAAFVSDHAAADHAVTGHGLVGGRDSGGNVRMLHPAVHAVFNDSSRSTGQPGRQSGPTQMDSAHARRAGGGDPQATIRPAARGGSPHTGEPRTDRGGRLGEGARPRRADDPQISNPSIGADEEHAMTEQATSLRDSLKSLATMVRGFALVFLASVLGILVTSVLALFSVVHIALAGVFLGLGVVSLLIVRTLNLRRREIRKRLRGLERTSSPKSQAKPQTAPAAEPAAPVTQRPAPAARPSSPVARPSASAQKPTAGVQEQSGVATSANRTSARTHTTRTSTLTSSGTAARIAAAAHGANGSTKAAQARAAMQRSSEAKKAREEADTGEIPLVRIRKEATEGHTTRQVLLTGPIPVVEEDTSAEAFAESVSDTADRSGEKTGPAEQAPVSEKTASESMETAQEEPTETGSAPVSLGSDLVDDESGAAETAADESDGEVRAALDAAAPKIDDPFMQRLKSRDGWSPTPLPVPSYVDAPEAEHPVPSASAADASSYETEARSREDIAAQFAAELGYRPELSDSAREEGPLEHGRKAIRTTKAADLGAVNDVLARRRA